MALVHGYLQTVSLVQVASRQAEFCLATDRIDVSLTGVTSIADLGRCLERRCLSDAERGRVGCVVDIADAGRREGRVARRRGSKNVESSGVVGTVSQPFVGVRPQPNQKALQYYKQHTKIAVG